MTSPADRLAQIETVAAAIAQRAYESYDNETALAAVAEVREISRLRALLVGARGDAPTEASK